MKNELNSGKLHTVKRWAGSLKEKLLKFDFMALFVSFIVTLFVLFGLAVVLALIVTAMSVLGPGGVALVFLGGIIWGIAFTIMKDKI